MERLGDEFGSRQFRIETGAGTPFLRPALVRRSFGPHKLDFAHTYRPAPTAIFARRTASSIRPTMLGATDGFARNMIRSL